MLSSVRTAAQRLRDLNNHHPDFIPDTAVLLVCAGNATRMRGIHKILHPLGDAPVLEHSLRTFCNCESVTELVVVCRKQDFDEFSDIISRLSLTRPMTLVEGGETRQQSVHNGFSALSPQVQYVAVHDGARPLVRKSDVEQVIADARIFGAATLGVPAKDTIKVVHDGFITDTPDRATLFLTQTPQVFRRSLYEQASEYARTLGQDFTDDCQLIEALGVQVKMTIGSYSNIKLTTPEDFAIAEALLNSIRNHPTEVF